MVAAVVGLAAALFRERFISFAVCVTSLRFCVFLGFFILFYVFVECANGAQVGYAVKHLTLYVPMEMAFQSLGCVLIKHGLESNSFFSPPTSPSRSRHNICANTRAIVTIAILELLYTAQLRHNGYAWGVIYMAATGKFPGSTLPQ